MKKLLLILLCLPLLFSSCQENNPLPQVVNEVSQSWEKTFNLGHGYFVQQTSDGGYIIGGETEVNGIDDVYLIKTDASGVEQWSQTFGGTSGDRGFSVQQTTDGGYVIAGYTQSFGVGYQNLYLIKTDDNGIEQWNKTYGGNPNSENWGNSVQQTTDGGYIICGSKYDDLTNSNGYSVVYLLKTDANGDINN